MVRGMGPVNRKGGKWLWVPLTLVGVMVGTGQGWAQAAVPVASEPCAQQQQRVVSRAPLHGKARFRPEIPRVRRHMSRAMFRAWLFLTVAQHGAAFFDARTTRDAIGGRRELDPVLRPFAHSAALYPVMQIGPLGLDWLARRMATSQHKWVRRIWWLPQAAATAGFLWSGLHNSSLPNVGLRAAP